MTVEAPSLPNQLTGYTPFDDYIAQETQQGTRRHYTVVLPLTQIPAVLPTPDPTEPFEDNRQVRLGHAQAFADYVRNNEHWHSGPLTVRTTSGVVTFEAFPNGDYSTLRVGVLRVPRNARTSFRIVDGQHRVLGIHLLLEQLNADLVKRKSAYAERQRAGEGGQLLAALKRGIDEVQRTVDRITRDAIGIDLIVEDDATRARQLFVDVANNALGITKTVKSRFDSGKVVNRAVNVLLADQMAPALVRNHIDDQKDRIVGSNANLLGAGHLADVIRILTVGIKGRVSPVQEKTLDERTLARTAAEFIAVLEGSFSDIEAVVTGEKTADMVRPTSLVVSTTMIRVLAGVFYELREQGATDDEIANFFRRLDKHVQAPVSDETPSGQMWMQATESGALEAGFTAPGARAQQVKDLVEAIASWFSSPPPEL